MLFAIRRSWVLTAEFKKSGIFELPVASKGSPPPHVVIGGAKHHAGVPVSHEQECLAGMVLLKFSKCLLGAAVERRQSFGPRCRFYYPDAIGATKHL